MANCVSYLKLTTIEKVELIGKIVHLVQNDEMSFLLAKSMIKSAEGKNLLTGIEILPEHFNKPNLS